MYFLRIYIRVFIRRSFCCHTRNHVYSLYIYAYIMGLCGEDPAGAGTDIRGGAQPREGFPTSVHPPKAILMGAGTRWKPWITA